MVTENPFKKKERARLKKAMAKRRKEIEKEIAEQTLTAEKVAKYTKDTASTAAAPDVEASREQSPPLTETERKWSEAVDRKAVNKFAVGLVQELVEEVITEIVGTIKVELETEQPTAQCPAGRAKDPEVKAAVASIMLSPRSDIGGVPIEDIPTGITGTRLNLPRVAIPGETEDFGGVSPSQLSDLVRRWFTEGRPVNPLVVQGERPLTPSFRSPRQGEIFEPISPVTLPRRTPRYGGMPVGMEPDRVAQFQEASGMICNPAVAMAGGSFEPTEVPELTPEEMGTVPEMQSQGREQHRDSDATVRYSPVHTEEDTSAKESTVGSPPPKKRKRKLSASERAASSSRAETVQKESGTKFVSKGKDIRNLQKAEARKRGVDEEDLHTPGKVKKKTHASSLYGELQHQEKASKAELRKQAASVQEVKKPIVFGGRGRGKGGRRKGQPKKDAGKARVTEGVQQRRLS